MTASAPGRTSEGPSTGQIPVETSWTPGWRALSWLLLVAGLCYLISTLAFALATRQSFITDWLYYGSMIAGYGHWDAAWLPYEGHRQVMTRLLTALEIEFTQGRNFVLAPLGLAAHLATALILIAGVRLALANHDAVVRRAAMGAALVLQFFAIDMEFLVRGDSQVQWVPFVSLFVVCACAAMGRALAQPADRRGAWLVVSFTAAAAASLSGIAGILVWPGLLFAVIVAGVDRRTLLWVVIAAAVVLVPFFSGNAPRTEASSGGLLAQLQNPGHLLAAVSAFLGVPVVKAMFVQPFAAWSFQAGVAVGIVILVPYAFFMIDGLIRRRADGLEAAALGLLMCMALWNGAFAVKHFGPGTEIAGVDRFWQPIMMCWGIIGLLAFRRWAGRGKAAAKAVMVVGLGMAGVFAPAQLFGGVEADAKAAMTDAVGVAIAAAVHDRTLQGRIGYDTGQLDRQNVYLRRRGLWPSHDAAARSMGTKLAMENGMKACGGGVDGSAAAPRGGGARRVWGTWPADVAAKADGIAIADGEGTVVGVARAWRAPWLPRYFPKLGPGPGPDQWYGYIRPSPAPPWTAYVLDAAGRPVCQLGAIKG